jgi:hypothetical protein
MTPSEYEALFAAFVPQLCGVVGLVGFLSTAGAFMLRAGRISW